MLKGVWEMGGQVEETGGGICTTEGGDLFGLVTESPAMRLSNEALHFHFQEGNS